MPIEGSREAIAQQFNQADSHMAAGREIKVLGKSHPIIFVNELQAGLAHTAAGQSELGRQAGRMSVFQGVGNEFRDDEGQGQGYLWRHWTMFRAAQSVFCRGGRESPGQPLTDLLEIGLQLDRSRRRLRKERMELSNRVYPVCDLRQKRLWISYRSVFGPLPNKSTDDLQTICDPVIGFSSVIAAKLLSVNRRLNLRLHIEHLNGAPFTLVWMYGIAV